LKSSTKKEPEFVEFIRKKALTSGVWCATLRQLRLTCVFLFVGWWKLRL